MITKFFTKRNDLLLLASHLFQPSCSRIAKTWINYIATFAATLRNQDVYLKSCMQSKAGHYGQITMTLDTKSASLFSWFSFCIWLLMRTALTESIYKLRWGSASQSRELVKCAGSTRMLQSYLLDPPHGALVWQQICRYRMRGRFMTMLQTC